MSSLHALRGTLLFATLAAVQGCDLIAPRTSPAEDFFTSCEAAPDPNLPASCDGPDPSGWSDQPRPVEAEPCPGSPSGGCSQVVIGRHTDTGRYMNCPGYIVLNRSDWTLALNDGFIACTSEGELGTCDPSVIVVSERADVPDFSEDDAETTVTSRELCQLHNAGCSVVFAAGATPGHVECSIPTPTEYVIWYTGNVCCWGAPHLLVTDRAGFDRPESASDYPGGGIDPSIPLVKVELQGGFASAAEANAWICPRFTSSSFHYWCNRHYQMDGHNWRPYGLACDFSGLPETATPPESNLCN